MSGFTKSSNIIERIGLLKQVPLFANLHQADIEAIAGDFSIRHYAKDEIVFHQGDDSGEMYIVISGKIRIFKTSPAGSETTLVIFAQSEIIGEYAAIDPRPRNATAKTIVATRLLQIRRERFLYYFEDIPELSIAMSRVLVDKMRWTSEYAETIAQYDAAGRLLHIVLLYNQRMGEEKEPGKRYVLDLGLNQTDLASLVGARREWVNRILGDWRQRGLIEYQRGKLTILDLPLVEAERDSRTEASVG